MTQPAAYSPTTDFSDDELNNAGGRSTVRTAQLDAEFAAIAATLSGVCANLALNQRDDGEIRDERVKLHTLAIDVRALLAASGSAVRGAWVSSASYALRDVVTQSSNTYICAAAHTSGVFATDLSAGKWVLLAIGSAPSAAGTPFSPTATIAAMNVQAAVEECDSENRSIAAANLNTALSASTALRTDLSSTSSATKGAGAVGSDLFNLNYAAATLGGAVQGGMPSIWWVLTDAEIADVKAYGYTIDLTAKIQAALDKWPAWWFPAGGYRFSTLNINADGRCIFGAGPKSAVLYSTASGVGGAAIKSGNQAVSRLYCEIRDVLIQASSLAVGYVVDWKSMQFGRLHNVWVYGGGVNGVGIRLDANWAATECTYNSVRDCYIGNVGKGISFGDGANTNTLVGNRIQPLPGGYGYFLNGTAAYRISNNTIVGGGCEYAGAVSRGIYAGQGVDVLTVVGVRFEYLAVGIESTSQANGLVLLGNYFSSCSADYALASTNTTRVEPYGLELPNAASSSSTGLDYYQRGTFTPVVIGTTTAGTGTYSAQSATYTRIGNRVHFELQVQITAHTGTGNLRIDGLPFVQRNQIHPCVYSVVSEGLTYAGTLRAMGVPNTTQIALYSETAAGALAAIAMDTSCNLIISGSYPV